MLVAASVIALCRVAKPSTFDEGVCAAMLSLMSWFSSSAFSLLQAIRVWRVFCTVRLSFIYTAAVTIEWSERSDSYLNLVIEDLFNLSVLSLFTITPVP